LKNGMNDGVDQSKSIFQGGGLGEK